MRRLPVKITLFSLCAMLFLTPGYAFRKHDNVEDIGNRDVSGRVFKIFPNFVSLEKEIDILNNLIELEKSMIW